MLYVAAVAQALLVPFFALAARTHHPHSSAARLPSQRPVPYPRLALPFQLNGSQYVPLAWTDIPGWSDDDQLAAFRTFRASCRPIAAQHDLPSDPKALGISLRDPCRAARATEISDGAKARSFFEERFTPLKISRLGEGDGFVTLQFHPEAAPGPHDAVPFFDLIAGACQSAPIYAAS